jgi:adenosylmethionine-8-amino-7-oxononanoate aminotransferase
MSASSPIWHPFTQHGLEEPVLPIASGKGAILHRKDGRKIIDGISSWWVTTHGHCHPRIVEAIVKQARKLDQVIFAGCTHEPAEKLARQLIALMPGSLTRVFFSDSGSTSVEVALKMALGYWANRGDPRHKIIVLEHGYHGDTVGGMSVGARGVFSRSYAPLLFDVAAVPFPAPGLEQRTLDALERLCRDDRPAAFIVEPLVLGAAGMLIYPAPILAEMRRICADHQILFIADEVMTGWGRTGTLLACEQAKIEPDLLCLSKGLTGGSLPLAVTMASEAIFEAHWSKDRSKQFFHSSSYTANPIACAAASANIAIWEQEPVMDRIEKLRARQARGLERLAKLAGISNPRQAGTIIALDVETAIGGYLSELAPTMLGLFREADVLLRPLGNSIYVMPPYSISAAELIRLHDVIEEVVRHVAAAGRNGSATRRLAHA